MLEGTLVEMPEITPVETQGELQEGITEEIRFERNREKSFKRNLDGNCVTIYEKYSERNFY